MALSANGNPLRQEIDYPMRIVVLPAPALSGSDSEFRISIFEFRFSGAHPILATTEEIEEAEVTEDLPLLPDFVPHVRAL